MRSAWISVTIRGPVGEDVVEPPREDTAWDAAIRPIR